MRAGRVNADRDFQPSPCDGKRSTVLNWAI